MHGVPAVGWKQRGWHSQAGLLTCQRITRIVTFCWEAQLSSCQVTRKQAAHELLLNWGKVKGPRTVAGAEGARGMADTKETEQSAQEPKSLRLKFIKLTVQ